MVVKLIAGREFTKRMFESSVISYGSKTNIYTYSSPLSLRVV